MRALAPGRLVSRFREEGHDLSDRVLDDGIATWVVEGHLSDSEAVDLRAALRAPEVIAVTGNLGAHLAISIALRFPFGSITRFAWTVLHRLRHQWPAWRGDEDAKRACRVHTLPVMLLALMPGIGSGAYLASKPLRTNRALPLIVLDSLLRHFPFRLYSRLHLVELTTWWATRSKGAEATASRGVRGRSGALEPWLATAAVVIGLNAIVELVALAFYLDSEPDWAFGEFGLVNSLNAAELALAGLAGVLAYRRFWATEGGGRDHASRSGIFLWGILGLGLCIFAIDDFVGIHERIGGWVGDRVDSVSVITNNADDVLTLAYGVAGLLILSLFRHELFALRASSTFLQAAVVAASAMLLLDAFAAGWVQPLEFPAQGFAVVFFLLATWARFREVGAGG